MKTNFSTPEANWNGTNFSFSSSTPTPALRSITNQVIVQVCHHCCIYKSNTAVKAGLVTATVTPSTIGSCNLEARINGQSPPVWVEDGGNISVTLVSSCTECTIDFVKTVDPCEPYGGSTLYFYKKTSKGTQMFVNTKKAINQNINKVKLKKLKEFKRIKLNSSSQIQ